MLAPSQAETVGCLWSIADSDALILYTKSQLFRSMYELHLCGRRLADDVSTGEAKMGDKTREKGDGVWWIASSSIDTRHNIPCFAGFVSPVAPSPLSEYARSMQRRC